MTDRFTIAPDGDGEPTIWDHADPARPREVAWQYGGLNVDVHRSYGPLVWQVLTSVLTPDEATVERLAEAMHDRLRWGSMHWSTQHLDREAAPHLARAVLAALRAPADPEGGAK